MTDVELDGYGLSTHKYVSDVQSHGHVRGINDNVDGWLAAH